MKKITTALLTAIILVAIIIWKIQADRTVHSNQKYIISQVNELCADRHYNIYSFFSEKDDSNFIINIEIKDFYNTERGKGITKRLFKRYSKQCFKHDSKIVHLLKDMDTEKIKVYINGELAITLYKEAL